MANKFKFIGILITIFLMLLIGCSESIGDYIAASSISRNGFARDAEAISEIQGQEVKLWGYLDHSNIYGDASAQAILGDYWSGDGPDENTWRFNVKAKEDDQAGQSFAVHVPNDQWRDAILKVFVADAQEQRATKVFITGTLFTFNASLNNQTRIGIILELDSAKDILFELPNE